MKKKLLPFFTLLFFLTAFLLCFAFSRDYQSSVNSYLQNIENNVNKLPDWETGFSLAKSNLESLEQALANISIEIKEERKQNPNYTVDIKLYSATGKRLKELEEIKNDLGDYLRKLNSDYQDMNEAQNKGRTITINNIAKSIIKYFKKVGTPKITDLDVSAERKDAQTLENNFKNIKSYDQLVLWNREEFKRSKVIYEKAIKIVEALKPIDRKMNEILKKYENFGKVLQVILSGDFSGEFHGRLSTGQININITGNSITGSWNGHFSSSNGSGPISGRWNGTYNPESGILKGQLSGTCKFKLKENGSVINYSISGNWKGKVIGTNKIQGSWEGKETSGTEFDRGSWEVNQ
ncbi:MAG: hypothetical protein HYU63_05385 [Armatimonadetes bacterium]|nr:hypothetical protein [Armatimonadota bacterium]